MDGVFFYLGLDSNHGTNIDLMTVLLHELGHGLGFQTVTNGATGAHIGATQTDAGYPAIWDDYLLDLTTGKTWTAMTATERAASAINTGQLVWNGPNAKAAAKLLASSGLVSVVTPAAVAGNYAAGTAAFGPALTLAGVSGTVVPVGGDGLACSAIPTVSGMIALIDRGTCAFTAKVLNAQNAGAIGVIVANNSATGLVNMGGSDPTITIPSVFISQADGATLKVASPSPFATLRSKLTGADSAGRPLMYTPNPYQGGSSVSHWDVSAVPNQLMEPAINADLQHAVKPPADLTLPLLQDIGWSVVVDIAPTLMLLLD